MDNNLKNIVNADRQFSKHKNLFIFTFLVFIFLILFCIGYFVFSKTINIKKRINTLSFKKLNFISVAKDITITYFIDEKSVEKVIIDGIDGITDVDNNNIVKECIIKTPHLRDKIYIGPTKIIYLNHDNKFNIPEKIRLRNGKRNYIYFDNLYGSLDNAVESDKFFQIQDEETYLAGDTFYGIPNKQYFKTIGHSHLIIDNEYEKKIKQDENYDTRTSNDFYDLKAIRFDFYGLDNVLTAKENVVLINKDLTSNSNFLRATINDDRKLKDVFLAEDVILTQQDTTTKSDFGFFVADQELMVLYKNVDIKSKSNKTKSEFYFYETNTKTGMSFNEYTILNKAEQNKIYSILEKMYKLLPMSDIKYIQQVINSNKENIKKYYVLKRENKVSGSQTHIVDRSKKVKVHLNSSNNEE